MFYVEHITRDWCAVSTVTFRRLHVFAMRAYTMTTPHEELCPLCGGFHIGSWCQAN